MLTLAEAETADITDRSDFPPLVGRADALRAVLDNEQTMLPGQIDDRIKIRDDPVEVNHNDRPRTRSNLLFDVGRAERMRLVDIGENRQCTSLQHTGRRGDEGVRSADDLVPRPDTQRGKRGMQGGGSAVRGDGVVGAEVRGQLRLELPAEFTGPVVHPAGTERFHGPVDTLRREAGPGRERFVRDRSTTKDSEFRHHRPP